MRTKKNIRVLGGAMEHEKTSVVVSSLLIELDGKYLFLEEDRPEGVRLNLPGGHVDAGESPEEAALREGKEETGFDLELLSCAGVLVNTWGSAHSIRLIFLARVLSGELQTESNAKPHWLTLEDLERNAPGIKKMNGIDEMIAMTHKKSEQRITLLDYRKKV